MKHSRWKKADLPEGSENPLNAAVVSRDRSTLDMVAEAVKHDQTMLAFQPVMQAMPPHQTAFYEGYIRVLDATGRVIPARDFMHVVEEKEIGRALDCLALQHGLRALMKLLFMPLAWLGVRLGLAIQKKIDGKYFFNVILTMLILLGLKLVVDGAGSI